MATNPNDDLVTNKEATEEEFTPFSVLLARDLIFMDWTIQFGGQLLGLLLGVILGFLFGSQMGVLFGF